MAVYLLHANHNGLSIKDWESFCSYKNSDLKDGKLQCSCGENYEIFKWQWETQNGNTHVLCSDDKEVLFHPVYSSGTAAVRGSDVLKQNLHHYWEIKILTKLYGTDVMVGVGSSKVSLNEQQYKFCSMLGFDNQSWGYSYHGVIQHNKLIRKYGSFFGLGSIIGVHLDMCSGTLEYYLNRKSLGVAFRGLKGKDLYPMVCSTAAQSAMKLTCSLSLDSTLQMKCLAVIRKHPKLTKLYHSIPGLSRLIKTEYFWLLPARTEEDNNLSTLTFEDEAVLPLSTIVGIHASPRYWKRMRTNKWGLYEPRADPDHLSYRECPRKTTVPTSRATRNDVIVPNAYISCTYRRSTRQRSPSPAVSPDRDEIRNLFEDIEGNFQEAFRTLSSTIDTMREVSVDGAASAASAVYDDIEESMRVDDVEGESEDDDDSPDIDHNNGLRCNLSDCDCVYDFEL